MKLYVEELESRRLEWARQQVPDTQVILLTGYGTIESAVDAIRLGAFDYLTKPMIEDELNLAIERALGQREIVAENKVSRWDFVFQPVRHVQYVLRNTGGSETVDH